MPRGRDEPPVPSTAFAGVLSIHHHGGITIVQIDPNFGGMPDAAHSTGVVNAALPIDCIGSALCHSAVGELV
jgi:chemotaxis response regulator CheB